MSAVTMSTWVSVPFSQAVGMTESIFTFSPSRLMHSTLYTLVSFLISCRIDSRLSSSFSGFRPSTDRYLAQISSTS